MANIQTLLAKIMSAIYGEEVRGAIHDSIEAINDEVEEWTGLQDGTVTTAKLASNAVTTAKIADGAITRAKLNADVVDTTLAVSGAPADAKTTGDKVTEVNTALTNYNCANLLKLNKNIQTQTIHGITFTFDRSDGSFVANGTATANTVISYFLSLTDLPSWLEKGKEYKASIFSSDSNLSLEIISYKDGYHSLLHTTTRGTFVIPNDAVGLWIRLYINNGVTVNNATGKPFISDTVSNAELENRVTTAESKLIAVNDAVDSILLYSIYGTYQSANLEVVTGKLINVNTQAEYTISSGAYAVYDVENILKVKVSGLAWGDSKYAMYAVVDADDNVLIASELRDGAVHNDVEVQLPSNAKKILINGTPNSVALKLFTVKDVSNAIENLNKTANIVIACTGDSTTEGMSTDGAHTAEYGKAPYPARLYTILVDNGYENVSVLNQGHGGERLPDICARIGAYPCLLTEDITIPADNTPVSLGTATFDNGRVRNTKLVIPYADGNGEDYNVYFTQSTTTNPVVIDGVEYNITTSNNTNTIKKKTADGIATTIKANSMLFVSNDRSPSINIVMGGINDLSSLTMERYIDSMIACAKANKGKYLILGTYSPIWRSWSDLTGTATQKDATYRRKCLEAFGVNWIDLYTEFSQHALEYALSAGYFSDMTEAEKEGIKELLDTMHIPGQFTYNGTQDNVHLNEVGYHVIAMIVYYRLQSLNYI